MRKIVYIPSPFQSDKRFLAYLNAFFPECEIEVVEVQRKKQGAVPAPASHTLRADAGKDV